MLGFQPQPQPDRGSASDVSERNLSGFSASGDVSEGNSSGFSEYSFLEDPFSIPIDGFLKRNLHRSLVPPDEHDLVNDQIIPGAPAPGINVEVVQSICYSGTSGSIHLL
ncbi:hypothetical protein Hanom_Chr16g01495481 [Helianthus anomalus]